MWSLANLVLDTVILFGFQSKLYGFLASSFSVECDFRKYQQFQQFQPCKMKAQKYPRGQCVQVTLKMGHPLTMWIKVGGMYSQKNQVFFI